jgi:8-oxo-dGTP diphosphatase
MQVTNFNLRVYGLLIHNGKVLITHEHRAGFDMTKFPGGGLEKGEGIEACLIREFQEEMNLDIQLGDLFYVNDFLQISAFNPKDQLISFYYGVFAQPADLAVIHNLIERKDLKKEEQRFEWVNVTDLRAEIFTFPIDQVVAEKLKLVNP